MAPGRCPHAAHNLIEIIRPLFKPTALIYRDKQHCLDLSLFGRGSPPLAPSKVPSIILAFLWTIPHTFWDVKEVIVFPL